MDIKKLNIILEQFLETFQINEMATINGQIRVNNEDTTNQYGKTQTKFAHFHWTYNDKIHFMFSEECPKNVSQLKQLIAFPEEKNILSSGEYKKLLKILQTKMNKPQFKGLTVYQSAMKVWRQLHNNRPIDFKVIN